MNKFARIIGTGSYLPPTVITNDDLSKPLTQQMSGLLRAQVLNKDIR